MLPTLVEDAPEGDDWIHKIKLDGYRTQMVIDGGKVQVFTRRGADWSAMYPLAVEAAGWLNAQSAIIDGEIFLLDAKGQSNYQASRKAIKSRPTPEEVLEGLQKAAGSEAS